jgi:hypothetical protein
MLLRHDTYIVFLAKDCVFVTMVILKHICQTLCRTIFLVKASHIIRFPKILKITAMSNTTYGGVKLLIIPKGRSKSIKNLTNLSVVWLKLSADFICFVSNEYVAHNCPPP